MVNASCSCKLTISYTGTHSRSVDCMFVFELIETGSTKQVHFLSWLTTRVVELTPQLRQYTVMFSNTQLMFCNSQFMFSNTQLVFCNSQFMFSNTQLMFCNSQFVFWTSQFMFWNSHFMFYTTWVVSLITQLIFFNSQFVFRN